MFYEARRYTGDTRKLKPCPNPACVEFCTLLEFIPTAGDVGFRWRCDAGHSFEEHIALDAEGRTWVETELVTRPAWMPAETRGHSRTPGPWRSMDT
jgi:hypothetical protein